jgi:hypothetical protein
MDATALPEHGLVLGNPERNREMDEFLLREGYEDSQRLYQQVVRCWCGGSFTNSGEAGEVFRQYQLCTSCGCLVLKVVLTPAGLEELYSARFYKEHATAIGYPRFEARWESDVHDRISVWIDLVRRFSRGGRLLEVGYSHGRFLLEISRYGFQPIGLELAAEIADWARAKNEIDIRCVRMEQLEESEFDIVFAADVLEHVYDPRDFVMAATKKLRRGATALFQTVIYDRPADCPAWLARPLYHTILFHRGSLRLLAPHNADLMGVFPSVFSCQFVAFRAK